ncbi:MAG: S8 family serine peptidase [Acidobacteria bacterium]|nr:S8 family serine peptidase [Acidobacteriota bacterium]
MKYLSALIAILLLVTASGCSRKKYPPRDTRSDIIRYSGIDRAWALSEGKGATVAVVDWQFDMHSETAGMFVHASSVVPDETIGAMKPWHGGWMADLVHQVAPKTAIIPINARSLKHRGYQDFLIQGIKYAADHGAAAVSSSMGPVRQTPELQAAIDYAEQRGTIFVDVHPEGIAEAGQKARPCAAGECDARIVHTGIVSAPAHPLKPEAARDVYTWPYDLDSNFQDGWGFSNAPPVVAGVIALMKSANPSLAPQQIRDLIARTGSERDGFKVLDAQAAVKVAAALGGH